jgi:hypothetical protein
MSKNLTRLAIALIVCLLPAIASAQLTIGAVVSSASPGSADPINITGVSCGTTQIVTINSYDNGPTIVGTSGCGCSWSAVSGAASATNLGRIDAYIGTGCNGTSGQTIAVDMSAAAFGVATARSLTNYSSMGTAGNQSGGARRPA